MISNSFQSNIVLKVNMKLVDRHNYNGNIVASRAKHHKPNQPKLVGKYLYHPSLPLYLHADSISKTCIKVCMS